MATPEQVAEYEAKWQKAVDEVFQLYSGEGWKEESQKEKDMQVFLRYDPSSSFAQVKAVVTINAPLERVEEVLKTVKTVDANTPKDQRDGNLERAFLGPCGDGSDAEGYFYIVVESPSRFVSAREFLLIQKLARRDGKIAMVRTSIVNDAIHPVQKGNVRGDMHFQGYVAETEGNHTKLTFIAHPDPCGSIPAMVYNTAVVHQGMNALRMKREIESQ